LDDDDTVRVRPPRRRRRWPWAVAAAAAAVLLAGIPAAVVLWPGAPPAPPATVAALPPPAAPVPAPIAPVPPPVVATPAPAPEPPSPPPVPVPVVVVPPPAPAPEPPPNAPPAPAFALGFADEAAILADPAEHLTLFRFAADPRIVVLDFPALAPQGRMFNRVAALTEKAGLPRDRVLNDDELDAAIRASGDTPATFYYGHDYPAAALVRFFALADSEHVALDADEERLRALLRQLGWFDPAAQGALISLSREGADPGVTPSARAAILHHELSHGAFFVDPAYADYVQKFWRTALTPAERETVTRFLASEDYDPADEVLMINEMQAYTMFTDDPHFFLPANFGMSAARRAALRAAFRRDLPVGWLREALRETTVPTAPVVLPALVPATKVAEPKGAEPKQERRSLAPTSSAPTSSVPSPPAAAPR
jgi:hypothetical protein